MYRPKVVIADDHALLHGAFKRLLEQDCEVVGCVSDGRALLDSAPKLKPDIVLLDIGMPLLNGLDSGHRLKSLLPSAKLIFITASEDPDLMQEALRNDASGYLLKHCAASELLLAIREVLCGRTYVTPLLARRIETPVLHKPARRKAVGALTSRQREILQLLGEGHSMRQAARLLGIKPRTVAYHKYRLMDEYGLRNSADVVQFAMKQRLVSPAL